MDDFNESEGPALSLEGAALSSEDADMNIQDRKSMDVPFDGSCCTLGPKNIPCWKQFSLNTIVLARQESLELDKKELDTALLAYLRAIRSDSGTSTGVRQT